MLFVHRKVRRHEKQLVMPRRARQLHVEQKRVAGWNADADEAAGSGAISLRLQRNGAVGFIDWLDAAGGNHAGA
jgi:hypothetical protein